MRKIYPALLLATVMGASGAARAESADLNALIEAGVRLSQAEAVMVEKASSAKIAEIAGGLVAAHPQQAALIVSAVILLHPKSVAAITGACVSAAPSQAVAIVSAAVSADPSQAAAITSAAVSAAPQSRLAIQRAVNAVIAKLRAKASISNLKSLLSRIRALFMPSGTPGGASPN